MQLDFFIFLFRNSVLRISDVYAIIFIVMKKSIFFCFQMPLPYILCLSSFFFSTIVIISVLLLCQITVSDRLKWTKLNRPTLMRVGPIWKKLNKFKCIGVKCTSKSQLMYVSNRKIVSWRLLKKPKSTSVELKRVIRLR